MSASRKFADNNGLDPNELSAAIYEHIAEAQQMKDVVLQLDEESRGAFGQRFGEVMQAVQSDARLQGLFGVDKRIAFLEAYNAVRARDPVSTAPQPSDPQYQAYVQANGRPMPPGSDIGLETKLQRKEYVRQRIHDVVAGHPEFAAEDARNDWTERPGRW